jgi:hypothetical protein
MNVKPRLHKTLDNRKWNAAIKVAHLNNGDSYVVESLFLPDGNLSCTHIIHFDDDKFWCETVHYMYIDGTDVEEDTIKDKFNADKYEVVKGDGCVVLILHYKYPYEKIGV